MCLQHPLLQLQHTVLLRCCRYNAQELVNLLWCHAALGMQPPVAFLDAAAAALEPQLPACDPSLAALAVYSMATLRCALCPAKWGWCQKWLLCSLPLPHCIGAFP